MGTKFVLKTFGLGTTFMKKICAWCNKEIGEEEGDESVITHGICASCAQRIISPQKNSLRAFLNRFEYPILLVDSNVEIKIANHQAQEALGKDLKEIEGYLGGEALECVYASQPGGCGKTEHCKACAIRKMVNDTHASGISLLRQPAYQNIETPDGIVQMRLFLSTEKVGNFVILRIDEANRVE